MLHKYILLSIFFSQLLQSVTSPSILQVLLKHLRQMLPYMQSFSSLTKPLLRILLKFWSTGEETVRVVAFINILRIATSYKESTLEKLLKVRSACYKEIIWYIKKYL